MTRRRLPRRALTVREREVLAAYLVTGSHKATAHTLGISEGTVGTHLARIYAKTGAVSAGHAAMLLGWLRIPSVKPVPAPSPALCLWDVSANA